VNAIKKMVEVYAESANKYERIGEWIERIGWERFFEKTGFDFTHQHIDDYRLAVTTWRTTTQFKY
jgi:sulfite reductase beta subunit